MKVLHMGSFILLVIGGLNWLLVGLLDKNAVEWLAGLVGLPVLEQAIYVIVGLAAIYEVVTHKANCKACDASSSAASV